MRVLLVQAFLGEDDFPVVPLGLLSLASYLEKHQVEIFDPNVVNSPIGELEKIMQEFEPVAIGLSLRNIDSTNKSEVVFYYEHLRKYVEVLRENSDGAIIIGGSGFSMFAEEIMAREEQIDFGVYLEGEKVLAQLLDNLGCPENVPSIYYRNSRGEVLFTGKQDPVEMEQIKMPAWHYLKNPSLYKNNAEAFGVETKRGCSLGCVYCVYGYLNGRKYRYKNHIQVVDEIELLSKSIGRKRFTFVDSIFNIPFDHAQAICLELVARQLPIKWSAWFSERLLDSEFLQLLEKAGCDHIILSPDAFSDSVLETLGKSSRNKDILHSYKLIRENGNFEVSYNFFKNPPGQTFSNFFGMLIFCLRAKIQLQSRVHFEMSVLRIEPHTKLFEIAVSEKVVDPDQSLLEPFYYVNRRTKYLEFALNIFLKLIGK